ncbi:hypothetical protein C8F04DRAFT_1281453 [Mycena alexandri]|uniref:Uncharacterized protein n=1 Tax=Mycena alexandri TaxID=1745969 RepID=A0AAD6RW50_9AGAR|nr:hypothetical protein C8F04DRAFT_1281453 [Mycena alexandri]
MVPPAQQNQNQSLERTSELNLSSGVVYERLRFLGLGKNKERECERQRIREAERGAPSAAELLTLRESRPGYDDSGGLNSTSSLSSNGTVVPAGMRHSPSQADSYLNSSGRAGAEAAAAVGARRARHASSASSSSPFCFGEAILGMGGGYFLRGHGQAVFVAQTQTFCAADVLASHRRISLLPFRVVLRRLHGYACSGLRHCGRSFVRIWGTGACHRVWGLGADLDLGIAGSRGRQDDFVLSTSVGAVAPRPGDLLRGSSEHRPRSACGFFHTAASREFPTPTSSAWCSPPWLAAPSTLCHHRPGMPAHPLPEFSSRLRGIWGVGDAASLGPRAHFACVVLADMPTARL